MIQDSEQAARQKLIGRAAAVVAPEMLVVTEIQVELLEMVEQDYLTTFRALQFVMQPAEVGELLQEGRQVPEESVDQQL
jgi:hypothetical protein